MSTTTEFEEIVENVVQDKTESVQNQKPPYPSDYDQEWSEFLLDQLADNELIHGAPTVDGLRRITERFFGEILHSRTQVLEHPTSQNNQRCTLCHSIGIKKYRTGEKIVIDGCVDVLYHKTPYPFKDHLIATADTRAEGKALRRALKIRVVTAEELQNEDEQEILSSGGELANDQQILAINQLCKRLNVSVATFVTSEHDTASTINELKNLEARLLISKLSEFQRTPKDIPDSCVGYDENWKTNFYGSSK